jgi:hypothetical protein
MYADLREMRKELRSIPASDREVAKGELVYKKLTTLESLAEMEKEGQNAIAAYSAPQQPEDAAQEATEQPKEAVYFVKFPNRNSTNIFAHLTPLWKQSTTAKRYLYCMESTQTRPAYRR